MPQARRLRFLILEIRGESQGHCKVGQSFVSGVKSTPPLRTSSTGPRRPIRTVLRLQGEEHPPTPLRYGVLRDPLRTWARRNDRSKMVRWMSQDMDSVADYYNELDDEGMYESAPHRRTNKPKVDPKAVEQFIQKQDENRRDIVFTYKPARFEAGWLISSLGGFFEQRWISDVLSKIKAGKEASVYLCKAGDLVKAPYIAAKVFRPRMLRNLKNDQLYRQDRAVLDETGHRIVDLGMLKAQKKRSTYGESIRHQSWLAFEFETLKSLHAAGADVPQPYEMGENAILMSYIGDEAFAAPTLNTVRLDWEEARRLHQRMLHNIGLMLGQGIVHGDLSAYNVLYWKGRITIIDFPQVVSPTGHRSAYQIFSRDVRRLCEYFARQGYRSDPSRLAAELWQANGYKIHQEPPPELEEE